MEERIVGVNAPLDLNSENLADRLRQTAAFGFQCVELNLGTLPLIVEGEVCQPYVRYLSQVMKQIPLHYTAHIGFGLELRDLPRYGLHKKVLFASIDICGQLGIARLVLHFEKASDVEREETAFLQAHREAAEYAAQKNVMLCMENVEIEHYRKVIEMVRRVDHPAFKMTLDLGHLFLFVNHFGGDFLQAVGECAPYVEHLHINDNTGHFEPMRLSNFSEYRHLPMGYRIAFGSGDIHLPPLWGKVPIREALEILHSFDYRGIFLCEYENTLYMPFGKEIAETTRKLIEEVFS